MPSISSSHKTIQQKINCQVVEECYNSFQYFPHSCMYGQKVHLRSLFVFSSFLFFQLNQIMQLDKANHIQKPERYKTYIVNQFFFSHKCSLHSNISIFSIDRKIKWTGWVSNQLKDKVIIPLKNERNMLTLSQISNFRLFQTQRVCR